jgi:hypothetical protein
MPPTNWGACDIWSTSSSVKLFSPQKRLPPRRHCPPPRSPQVGVISRQAELTKNGCELPISLRDDHSISGTSQRNETPPSASFRAITACRYAKQGGTPPADRKVVLLEGQRAASLASWTILRNNTFAAMIDGGRHLLAAWLTLGGRQMAILIPDEMSLSHKPCFGGLFIAGYNVAIFCVATSGGNG